MCIVHILQQLNMFSTVFSCSLYTCHTVCFVQSILKINVMLYVIYKSYDLIIVIAH